MVKIVLTLPNWLTLLRVALIPVFVILLRDPTPAMVQWAVYIFCIAAVTDYLDGFIARRMRSVSDFGKLLDPLADKILVLSALIMLTSLRSDLTAAPWVPGWMVVMVVAREIWVTGVRGVAATHGVVIAANESGKWKSFLQMVAIIFLLLHDQRLRLGGIVLTCEIVGLNLLFLSLVFSYRGAFQYTMMIFYPKSGEGDGTGAPSLADASLPSREGEPSGEPADSSPTG